MTTRTLEQAQQERAVRVLLDRYEDEALNDANLAGDVERVTGLYFSPSALADYIREVGAVADELIGGPFGFKFDDVEAARRQLVGVRSTSDEQKQVTRLARVIAVREIERGLLG